MKKVLTLITALVFSTMAFAQIPTTGLSAYWNFDNNARDTSGHGHHLTAESLSGNAAYTTGMKGGSVISAGGLYNDDNFLPSYDFSVGAWVKHPASTTNGFPTIIELNQSLLLRFLLNYTSIEGGFAYNPAPLYATIAASTPVDTNWHHYMGVHNAAGQVAYIYIDGAIVNTLAIGATLSLYGMAAPHLCMVGYGPGGSTINPQKYLQSNIDELLLYTVPLDSTQVRAVWCDAMPVPAISNSGNTLSVPASFTNVQWNLNGSAVSGATGNSYTATASGNYTVTANYNYGCSKTSTVQAVTIGTGIAATNDIQFSVTPNPANDFIIINAAVINAEATVYNITGKIVLQEKMNSSRQSFNTGELTPGLYIIELKADGKVSRAKFVKE